MITITDIEVSLRSDYCLKAFVTITVADSFRILGFTVRMGMNGLFVAPPLRKDEDGRSRSIAYPLDEATRAELKRQVLQAYWRARVPEPERPAR